MKFVFKAPRLIDGVHFQKGANDVPKEIQKHWYFLAGVKAGVISVPQEQKPLVQQYKKPVNKAVPQAKPQKAIAPNTSKEQAQEHEKDQGE